MGFFEIQFFILLYHNYTLSTESLLKEPYLSLKTREQLHINI